MRRKPCATISEIQADGYLYHRTLYTHSIMHAASWQAGEPIFDWIDADNASIDETLCLNASLVLPR